MWKRVCTAKSTRRFTDSGVVMALRTTHSARTSLSGSISVFSRRRVRYGAMNAPVESKVWEKAGAPPVGRGSQCELARTVAAMTIATRAAARRPYKVIDLYDPPFFALVLDLDLPFEAESDLPAFFDGLSAVLVSFLGAFSFFGFAFFSPVGFTS